MTASLLRELTTRWATARPGERANAQSYVIGLCQALGVEPPRPAGSGYEFEYPIRVVSRDGTETTNFIDLYKAHHFALEAKDEAEGKSNDLLLRKAFGQLRGYVGHLPHERPPYLLVLDVGRTLLVWDRWNGDYGGFNAARRIDLRTLADRPEDAELLRDIWTDPAARDPRSRAIVVTREIAGRLGQLAVELEREGYEYERVARFIMRCVFTMFAEDVGLLPGEPFRRLLDEAALEDPREFVPLAAELWRAMDWGERFLLKKLLRFNGHFFRDAEALPLSRNALSFLLSAAEADWQHVEPTIFGTLLTRALDPVKRHRLGAEYTPREFVERLVRPTVEQPLRERWTAVQAEVLQLRESGRPKDRKEAEQRLRDFHEWLRSLRFLDPACGSGNFLYVTMHLVKRIELEVIRALEELTGAGGTRLASIG
ncbi:MAG: type IIL restriction-modification enzyme MmeI [Longimicrobiaceae bacterium]